MIPRAFIPLAVGMAAILLAPWASAQTLQDQENAYDNGGYSQPRDHGADWSDDAHRRDRVDTVRVDAQFADNEAGIRSQLDAGLAQGWLDRDDFLIFARQLHQTELREVREQRVYGGAVPEHRSALIRGELDELRRQLDNTRREH